MKKIKFLGIEYDAETFEYDVDIFSLSDSELDLYAELLPEREYFETGGLTWNGDDEYIKSISSRIIDERYI